MEFGRKPSVCGLSCPAKHAQRFGSLPTFFELTTSTAWLKSTTIFELTALVKFKFELKFEFEFDFHEFSFEFSLVLHQLIMAKIMTLFVARSDTSNIPERADLLEYSKELHNPVGLHTDY